MNLKSLIISLLAVMWVLTGCKGNENRGSAEDDRGIVRLDDVVASFPSMSAAHQHIILDSLAVPLGDYLYMMGLREGELAASIDTLASSAAYSFFYPDVAQHLNPKFDDIESAVIKVDRNISSTFASIPRHDFFGIISPYRQQIMQVDSAIFIALNHYLGTDYEGYKGMPEYQRRIKTPGHLPYDVAESILAISYPYESSPESTALNRMLYEGALAKSVVSAVEGGSLQDYLGWTDEEMAMVRRNEAEIWNLLITNKLLYSTDTMVADRLIAPSPATSSLSPELPGRVGRYVGYAIVESYLNNNPGVGLESLLSPGFYNDDRSLIKSGYTPGT